MVSYDVKALFTSLPMDLAISFVKHKLEWKPLLPHRTSVSIQHIITLLQFCLKNNYSLFHGIANLFMEEFESKAISTAPINPGFGLGMWMTPLSPNMMNIMISSSNIASPLTLTSTLPQKEKDNGSTPFLDTPVFKEANNTLTTSVYRKHTHVNQYLHWDSNHNLSAYPVGKRYCTSQL